MGYGREYPVLRLDSTMPFGKHKGKQIEDMIHDHPSYMGWLYNESYVKFDNETAIELERMKII